MEMVVRQVDAGGLNTHQAELTTLKCSIISSKMANLS